MAAAKKKLDEKHVGFLRELSCLADNKYCFDCNQRGPTYVNMTIGAFVCTACSGLLRGLNPPHRVKSISMGNFSPEEMEILKSRGNWFCKKTWLSLHDNNSMVDRAQNQLRDFLAQKYEKRLFYSPPTPDIEAKALRENGEAFERAESGGGGRTGVGIRATVGKNASKSVIIPSNRTAGSGATAAVTSNAAISVTVPVPSSTATPSVTAASSSFGMSTDFAANLFDSNNSLPTGAQPSSSYGSNGLSGIQKQGLVNFDAFGSVGSGTLPPGFGGSPLFALPSSSAAAEPVRNSAPQVNLGSDRYAAFADLDGLFGTTPAGGASSSVGATRSVFENSTGTTSALNRYTTGGATSFAGDSVPSSSGGSTLLNWGASCNTNVPAGSGWNAFGSSATGASAQGSILGQPGVSGAAAVPANPFSNPNPFASSSMGAGAAAATPNIGWGQPPQPSHQANFAWNWSASSGGTSAANPFANISNGSSLLGSSSSAAASGGFVSSASSTNPFL